MLKKGDMVKVYQCPGTLQGYEGDAKLIRKSKCFPGPGMELWEVEFEPGELYLRYVFEESKKEE